MGPFGTNRSPFGRRSTESPKEDEGWLLTYADTITNLMALFLMMLAISKVDMSAYEQVTSNLHKQFSGKNAARPMEEIQTRIKQIVKQKGLSEEVDVSKDGRGVVVEFASSVVFESGEANLLSGIKPTLGEIANELKGKLYQNYTIEVEGHTDDAPIHTARFPSNWELSTNRATNVVQFLLYNNVEKNRLKAAGYADIQPKLPNRDSHGQPIEWNRAKNRRIVIRLYPSLPTQLKKI